MAYRKNRRFRRKRTRRSRKTTLKTMRSIAQSVVNKTIEMKDIDFPLTTVGYNQPSAASESFTNIGYGGNSKICKLAEGIGQGYNDGEFIGHSFNIKGVHLHFAIGDPVLTTYATPAVRFIIFRPKGHAGRINWNTNGDFIKQLLSNVNPGGDQYLAPIDTDYFKVYWQKTVYVPIHYNPQNAGSVSYTPKIINAFVKFPGKGLNCQYDEGVNGMTNDVYIAAISSLGTAPYINAIAGRVKVYYTDA